MEWAGCGTGWTSPDGGFPLSRAKSPLPTRAQYCYHSILVSYDINLDR